MLIASSYRTVLGSIPASFGTVESEGRQMKQCWILNIVHQKEKNSFLEWWKWDLIHLSSETYSILRPQSRQSAKLFLKSSELGLPQPLTRSRVCPPPRFWGRGTLAGKRGVGRDPILTRGHTLGYSLYIRTLWLWLLFNIPILFSPYMWATRSEIFYTVERVSLFPIPMLVISRLGTGNSLTICYSVNEWQRHGERKVRAPEDIQLGAGEYNESSLLSHFRSFSILWHGDCYDGEKSIVLHCYMYEYNFSGQGGGSRDECILFEGLWIKINIFVLNWWHW